MCRCVLLVLAVVACSAKAPSGAPPAEAPHAPPPGYDPVTPVAGPPGPPSQPADPREAEVAKSVSRLLEEDHLLHKPIDAGLSRAAFDTYMERLDGEKVYLLKSERDQLARLSDKIGDEMRSGNLELAHEGERMFHDRIEVVDKLVQDVL